MVFFGAFRDAQIAMLQGYRVYYRFFGPGRVQIDLKIKEKKKYEKLAEFVVSHAGALQIRKEDDEAEETVVIRWRST